MKLSIIIPVFNEKDTILPVLDKIQKAYSGEKEIIIIDDYSSDGTRELLTEYCSRRDHIRLSFNEANYGKGRSIRNGLLHATGDFVVIQDADLELDPSEYNKLIAFGVEEKGSDVVFGSRFLESKKGNVPINRVAANKILTSMINILYGSRLTDIMTCYKLIKRDVFLSLGLKCDRFDIEAEITCKLLKKGIGISEVPIDYNPRSWEQGKKIRAKDFFNVSKAIFKYRFSD